jgi:hypothetical protein
VICVSKKKQLRYRVADIAVSPNSQAGGEVGCREEHELIGLGAATVSGVMTINTM